MTRPLATRTLELNREHLLMTCRMTGSVPNAVPEKTILKRLKIKLLAIERPLRFPGGRFFAGVFRNEKD